MIIKRFWVLIKITILQEIYRDSKQITLVITRKITTVAEKYQDVCQILHTVAFSYLRVPIPTG